MTFKELINHLIEIANLEDKIILNLWPNVDDWIKKYGDDYEYKPISVQIDKENIVQSSNIFQIDIDIDLPKKII